MGTPSTFTVSVVVAPPFPVTVIVVVPAPSGVIVSVPVEVLAETIATTAFAVVAVKSPSFPVCVTVTGAGDDALLTKFNGFGAIAMAGTAVGVAVGATVAIGVGVAVGTGVGVAVGAAVGEAVGTGVAPPTIGATGCPPLPLQPATAAKIGTSIDRRKKNVFVTPAASE